MKAVKIADRDNVAVVTGKTLKGERIDGTDISALCDICLLYTSDAADEL